MNTLQVLLILFGGYALALFGMYHTFPHWSEKKLLLTAGISVLSVPIYLLIYAAFTHF